MENNEQPKNERTAYRVLSEIQLLDTVYPAGELVELTEEQAKALPPEAIELHAGNEKAFALNNPSTAYAANAQG